MLSVNRIFLLPEQSVRQHMIDMIDSANRISNVQTQRKRNTTMYTVKGFLTFLCAAV